LFACSPSVWATYYQYTFHPLLVSEQNDMLYIVTALLYLYLSSQESMLFDKQWIFDIVVNLVSQLLNHHRLGWLENVTNRFKCIDLDGNGVLTRNELQFFYEEQLHRMECMAQEPVLFEDILCQLIDMIKPEVCPFQLSFADCLIFYCEVTLPGKVRVDVGAV